MIKYSQLKNAHFSGMFHRMGEHMNSRTPCSIFDLKYSSVNLGSSLCPGDRVKPETYMSLLAVTVRSETSRMGSAPIADASNVHCKVFLSNQHCK